MFIMWKEFKIFATLFLLFFNKAVSLIIGLQFCQLCFRRDGGGSPGRGIPVHHNTRGYWPAAVLSGPEPDLSLRSAFLEKTSQPHQGEDGRSAGSASSWGFLIGHSSVIGFSTIKLFKIHLCFVYYSCVLGTTVGSTNLKIVPIALKH